MKIIFCIWGLLLAESGGRALSIVGSRDHVQNFRSRTWKAAAYELSKKKNSAHGHIGETGCSCKIQFLARASLYVAVPLHAALLAAAQATIHQPLSPSGMIHAALLGVGLWGTIGIKVRICFDI